MGIYDRDYYRGDSERMFASIGRWSATVWLIVITCVVFFLEIITRDADLPGLLEGGAYRYSHILAGEIWRFVTPIFLHWPDSFIALVFEMLALYMFGRTMEEQYGSRSFVLFYLLAGIAGYVGVFVSHLLGLAPVPLVGSWGAVSAVLVLFALNHPRQQVLLFFVLPVPIWALVVIFMLIGSLGLFRGPMGAATMILNLTGALVAFVAYRSRLRLPTYEPTFGKSPRPAPRPRLRVVPAEDDEPAPRDAEDEEDDAEEEPARTEAEEALESKLDRVLEKVSRHGQESLTGAEREILFRASEVYKKRRK